MSTAQLSVFNLNMGSVDIPSTELDVKTVFPDTDLQSMDAVSIPNGISTIEVPQTNGSASTSIPPAVDEDVKSVEDDDDDDDDDIRIHLSMDQKTRLVKQPVARGPQSVAAVRAQLAISTAAPAVVAASSASSTAAAAPATPTRTNSTSGNSSAAAAGLARSPTLLPFAG